MQAPRSTAETVMTSTIALGRPSFTPEYCTATDLSAVVLMNAHSANPRHPCQHTHPNSIAQFMLNIRSEANYLLVAAEEATRKVCQATQTAVQL